MLGFLRVWVYALPFMDNVPYMCYDWRPILDGDIDKVTNKPVVDWYNRQSINNSNCPVGCTSNALDIWQN